MKAVKTFATLFLVLILAVNASGQEKYGKVGKIFTKAEADKQFGPVLKSVVIDLGTAKTAATKAGDYILFKIKNDKPLIADKSRNVVYTTGAESLKSEEVLYMYSVSVFNELLEKGKSDTVILEQRETVFSVTNGAYTMEVAWPCPPMCW